MELDEVQVKRCFAYRNAMLGGNGLKAGVERAEEVVGAAFDLERKDGVIGYDDGADVEVVRRYGRDDEVVGIGEDDRAATAQRIARRACGRSHDDAIGPVGVEVFAIDVGVYGNHRRGVALENRAIVEGKVGLRKDGEIGIELQQGASVDVVRPFVEVVECLLDARLFDIGQKAEPAQVDTR